MSEQTNSTNTAGGSTGSLNWIETGSVSFFLKSEPNKLSAQEFGSLLIADGCMVITWGDGRSLTHTLSDVEKVIVRPCKNTLSSHNFARRDEPVSR